MKIFKMAWTEKVLKLVKLVPAGRITTYQELAKASGRSKAYRAVGGILNRNPYHFCQPFNTSTSFSAGSVQGKIPCHRVVRSDGYLGGFSQGSRMKARLLQVEGIKISKSRVVDWRKYLYKFPSEGCLIRRQ